MYLRDVYHFEETQRPPGASQEFGRNLNATVEQSALTGILDPLQQPCRNLQLKFVGARDTRKVTFEMMRAVA